MGFVQLGQLLSCTFCQKFQRDVKKLIASPDKHAYICDECTVEPSRLTLISAKSGDQRVLDPSLCSRVRRLLRNVWSGRSTTALRCSFCLEKRRSIDLYASPVKTEIGAQICADCLAVCRQVLRDEAKEEHAQEKAIEAWMLAIIKDGGIARLDDLHIDRLAERWKRREMWIPGGLEAFRLTVMLRDRHQLPFTVGLAFSLEAREHLTGMDFRTTEQLAAMLDWSPPSLYLFKEEQEPGKEIARAIKEGSIHGDAVVRDLEQGVLGSHARRASCYYTEFREVGSTEYRRSVILEG
jgi:hypothetical protein